MNNEKGLKAIERSIIEAEKDMMEAKNRYYRLKRSREDYIFNNNMLVKDLTPYIGKNITSIKAVRSDGFIIDLPKNQIMTSDENGKLSISGMFGGKLHYSEDRGGYIKTRRHYDVLKNPLEIHGFFDIEVEETKNEKI